MNTHIKLQKVLELLPEKEQRLQFVEGLFNCPSRFAEAYLDTFNQLHEWAKTKESPAALSLTLTFAGFYAVVATKTSNPESVEICKRLFEEITLTPLSFNKATPPESGLN